MSEVIAPDAGQSPFGVRCPSRIPRRRWRYRAIAGSVRRSSPGRQSAHAAQRRDWDERSQAGACEDGRSTPSRARPFVRWRLRKARPTGLPSAKTASLLQPSDVAEHMRRGASPRNVRRPRDRSNQRDLGRAAVLIGKFRFRAETVRSTAPPQSHIEQKRRLRRITRH